MTGTNKHVRRAFEQGDLAVTRADRMDDADTADLMGDVDGAIMAGHSLNPDSMPDLLMIEGWCRLGLPPEPASECS